jgi:hypothetical protein
VLGEQTHELGAAPALDGVVEARALRPFVRVGAAVEEQPDALETVVVESMRERLRAVDRRTALEEQAQEGSSASTEW